MTTGQTILLSIGSSTVLVAIINGVFALIQSKAKTAKGVEHAVQLILQDRLKFLCRKHISEDGITTEDLEDLMRMHKIYHDELKGNGYLDTLMTQVKALPLNPKVTICVKSN